MAYDNDITIREGTTPETKGKFYVARGSRDFAQYLHDDGVWRSSTRHMGRQSGYFDSREKAEEMIKRVT